MTHYVDGFMRIAFEEARQALREGEVPVGCVLVHRSANEAQYAMEQAHTNSSNNSQSIACCVAARGRNATNAQRHALAHAEYMAVHALLAQQQHDNSIPSEDVDDLSAWVLYVTVEPCIMCAAFLLYNRIGHVFYGCANSRFGGNGSILALHDVKQNRLHTCCTHSNTATGVESGNTSKEELVSDTSSTCNGLWGYPSEGGHRKEEAIALLQAFYKRENPFAPGHKRRRKGESANDGTEEEEDNDDDTVKAV